MHANDPESFAIGPVTFMTRSRFNESMEPHFEAYVRNEKEPQGIELREGLLADARHYYEDFTWVARVQVLNCDAGTSKMRANIVVTAALNFLHAFFGAYHTRRMNVAGPRLERDRRACFTIDADNLLDVSCSSRATSAVGFADGWGAFLEGETMALLLRGSAKALEPLVNPAVQRPLGMRLVDGAAWFGDAVRESSPAAQIVKAVTGLEALVMTGEHEDITSLLSARSAAVAYQPMGEKTFTSLEEDLREAYDMRSRLAHGSLSPFDPEVQTYAEVCLHQAEQVICGGLELFESHGLIDTPRTVKELGRAFDQLVVWAKAHSAARA
jgi:Apea-like HEPN